MSCVYSLCLTLSYGNQCHRLKMGLELFFRKKYYGHIFYELVNKLFNDIIH